MACVSEVEVLGFVRGTLERAQRSTIETHLDSCEECLELVTLAGKTSLAATVPPAPSEDDVPPMTIDRYAIEAPLGHGAMGTVYAARDTRLGRRVAIKLVHPRLAGDERSQVGLLREAQALARIAQPNVLTVHDVGVVDNAVFLAAELVEGDTLEAWLRAPRRWRAIASVFLQAARGLDAAHVAGLVHRDFKPSNVLIGHDGRVRVFDFGLARFSDAGGRAEIAGTPLYMSPEQLRGEVADARSDQYAFCVALHEALYGYNPARADRRVSAALDRPPRWLRELVRRGLARDPASRFPAVRDVIRGLERGLARRSRALLAGTAAVAVTAAATLAIVAYERGKDEPLAACPLPENETWNDAQKVQLATVFAQTGAPYAAATLVRVRGELDRFATRLASQTRDACIAQHTVADAELDARRTTCLEQQRLAFDGIVAQFLAADRTLVERAHSLLGALPDVESCAHARGPAWPQDPGARARFQIHFRELVAVRSIAEAGKFDEAERRAAQIAADAKTLGFRQAEGDAAYLQGHIAGMKGRVEEAVKLVEAALWIGEETRYDELVVTAANELVYLLAIQQRKPEEARPFVKLARSAAERMGTPSAQARTARSIGNIELTTGHFTAAEEALHRAVRLNVEGDPILTAFLMMDLANLASQRGRAIESEVLIRYAISIYRRELGELHPRHAQLLNNLANTLMDLRRHDEAAVLYDQAIAIYEKALGPDNPQLGTLYSNANGVHIARSDVPRAREMVTRGVKILENGGPRPHYASALYNLAQVERIEGHDREAERLFERTLAVRLESLGEHHHLVIESLLAIASMKLARGDHANARALCKRAAATMARSDVGNQAWQASIDTCFGELELAEGRPERARTLLEGALARHDAAHDVARRAYTQFVLARALPPRERPRALELARAARAAFVPEGALFKPEIDAIDRWLQRS